MKMSTKIQGDVMVVVIHEKRMDAKLAVPFKNEMLELIDEGHCKIVLNLQDVDFIDSSGLGAMVAVFKAVDGKGDLALTGLRDNTRQLLRMTRMDQVFSLYGQESEAVSTLAG